MSGRAHSPALQEALAHDAAGQHEASINLLARATGAGDLAAMSELGHRLLVGDRAPPLEREGRGLIVDAARAGEGRALARLAALTAAGAGLPQDWPGALRLLGEAAAAGDAGARGQLEALQPPGGSPGDWPTLASRVPLEAWLSSAPSEALHEKVHRVRQLAPPSVCAWLISRADGRLERARVYDSVSRSDLVLPMRSNTVANFNLSTIDVAQLLVQSRMALSCSYPGQHLEPPMVLHYDVGEEIRPHFDFIDAKAPDYEQQIREQGQRMITFLLYLNDAYEGGETTFPELGLVNRGRLGDGLFFINAHADGAPDRRMLHTGSPPTAGEKWIVTQFVRNIPLRP
jgi:prolyl 4-hydroxylase